jgi:hypothetical protein
MIFLNPAVLFGLLASSIPILIHLFNLRKLKKIEFSTLYFLKELQKNKIRKVKLKQWLLLALRVLIILFLVTAFSRPTLKGVALGGTTSSAKTTAVFLFDDTFSMSVVGTKGSFFNQEKQSVYELLSQLQEGDEAALVLVSDQSHQEIKPTNNLIEFRRMIDNLQLSYSSGGLNNAFVKAAKIMGESKNFNKEIYILSDFQQGLLRHNEEISNLSQLLDEKVKVYTINYSGKDVFNLGVDNLVVNSQIFEKDKPVSFSATITNYSKQPVNNAVVSLFVNGERNAQQSISLSEGESKNVAFETTLKKTGNNDVFVELEDDDILQDNKRYTNVFVPDKIQVALFTDEDNDAAFTEVALGLDNGEGSMTLTKKNLSQLSSVDLSKFGAVIIIGSENLSNPERLVSYLNNGGGLMIFPGSKTTLSKFQKLCGTFGIPYPAGVVGKVSQAQNASSFGNIETDHPVFQNLFESRDKKKIESPDVYQYIKIQPGSKGKNVISMADNSAFFSEYKAGQGKVLLFATAPVLSWSSFPLKAIFVPLLNKSVFYLASKDRDVTNYYAGSSVDINLSKYPLPQIKVAKTDNSSDNINIEPQYKGKVYTYANTNSVGNYKFYSGDNLIDNISINADPAESKTEYLSKSDLKDYLDKTGFKGKYTGINSGDNLISAVLQSRYGSELWKYFLIVALLLAITEMAVARSAKKEMDGIEK